MAVSACRVLLFICLFSKHGCFDIIDDMSVSLEGQKEEEIVSSHKTDSLSMLILICLLIATVLVIWLFKIKKFSIFHETGVAMIFGIIVGGIIR